MEFINLTPHDIRLNDGTIYKASGDVARVSMTYSKFDENNIASVSFGKIEGLPEPKENTYYIVSAIVAQAANRSDVISPATGHSDAVRTRDGFILSVPGFIGISDKN